MAYATILIYKLRLHTTIEVARFRKREWHMAWLNLLWAKAPAAKPFQRKGRDLAILVIEVRAILSKMQIVLRQEE
jgi:hypothetical protein